MEHAETLNANIAQCLVTKTHWGYDVIHNICNDTQKTVDWAMGDYADAIAVGGLLLIFALLIIGIFTMLIDSITNGY